MPAEGYPSFDSVISPAGSYSVESQVLGPDWRNAGCNQIVKTITDVPPAVVATDGGNVGNFGFALTLKRNCPHNSVDFFGKPLALEEMILLQVTGGPRPGGGYWATHVELR